MRFKYSMNDWLFKNYPAFLSKRRCGGERKRQLKNIILVSFTQ